MLLGVIRRKGNSVLVVFNDGWFTMQKAPVGNITFGTVRSEILISDLPSIGAVARLRCYNFRIMSEGEGELPLFIKSWSMGNGIKSDMFRNQEDRYLPLPIHHVVLFWTVIQAIVRSQYKVA